ncbi:MAG: hypothetical protein Q9220_003121 [cf. Caloplaca sp. 1 TL-2023]
MSQISDSLKALTLLFLFLDFLSLTTAAPRCWYPEVTEQPLVFKNCNDIIMKDITRTDGLPPDIPLTFSRDSALRPDIQTPRSWVDVTKGNCAVGVDIPAALGGLDKTSLNDIRGAALAVAFHCVIQPPHLGGILQIGWGEKINVVVVAFDRPGSIRLGNGTVDEE